MNTLWVLIRLGFFFLTLIVVADAANGVLSRRFGWKRRYLPLFAWGWVAFDWMFAAALSLRVEADHLRWLWTALIFLVPLVGIRPKTIRKWRLLVRTSPGLWSPATLILLLAFVGLMMWVGIYLEFPSDAVYHLDLTQSWVGVEELTPNAEMWHLNRSKHLRTSYFLNQWLIDGPRPALSASPRLDLLAAILAGALLFGILRLAFQLEARRSVAWLAGIASLAFFGHNAFSFYRYMVLAPGFWMFVLLLEAIVLMVGICFENRWRYLVLIVILFPTLWRNHPQELMLLGIQLTGLAVFAAIIARESFVPAFRQKAGALIAFFTLAIVSSLALGLNLRAGERWVEEFEMFGLQLHHHSLGRTTENLGIVGWIAIVLAAAVVFSRTSPLALRISAMLAFWPSFLLLNPLTFEVLLRFLHSEVTVRVLYSTLFWLFLALLLGHLERLWSGRRRWLGVLAIFAVCLLGSALSPQEPWRGRLRHLLYPVAARVDGTNLEGALWYLLDQHPSCVEQTARPDPLIISGPYFNTFARATGRFRTLGFRDEPKVLHELIRDAWASGKARGAETLAREFQERGACFIVALKPDQLPKTWIQQTTGHWGANRVESRNWYPPILLRLLRENPDFFQPEYSDQAVDVFRLLPRTPSPEGASR